MMDAETRKALHDIRDTLTAKLAQVDINTTEIVQMREMFEKHIQVCNKQADTLGKVEELLGNIEASYKFSNIIRKIFLWFTPIGLAAWAWYKQWKGM